MTSLGLRRRADILAESQTALKLRFNWPDKDLTRPGHHFVTVVINFFLSRAADCAESESESESLRHVIQKKRGGQEGALTKMLDRQRVRPSMSRSLVVRNGQTSPHRPRLVVSRSTCSPLSPSPHANSFVIGPAVINTHTCLL